MLILAVGCEGFDDSAIWDKLTSLEGRIAALEQLCAQMNTNISSLQSVVEALQKNDYVTNIAPITEDGKTIGYTLTFSKSGSVTIYHGKDGQNGTNGTNGANGIDGVTPVIGVKKADDGIYYWTINGEWLLDDAGNKVKAQGTDGKNGVDGTNGTDGTNGIDGTNGTNGKNGSDGITPKLKIENGYWKVSYDGGNSWEELGKATGEDGDSMFDNVTYDDDYVYITLTDGTELVVPRHINNNDANILSNQIWYTSIDGEIVTPHNKSAFGANIISYIYENGKGIITFDGDITSIGEDAFNGSNFLTSITIPNGVTSIGENAFWGCTSLESIAIPDSVTSIGESAFTGCGSLTSVTIPDSVTTIGVGAFVNCSNLTSFYGKFASGDNRCLVVDGVLNSFAPAGLTTYTIPNSVTSIGTAGFINCSSLISVIIPDSVTSIGNVAFSGCSNLESVIIGNGVTSIGKNAFGSCGSLTSITIPYGVTSIGEYTFSSCSSLNNVTIPDSVTSIGKGAFVRCESLTNITIPNSVTSIEMAAFQSCYSLMNVTISDSVTTIGDFAFDSCPFLTSVTIPKNVASIGVGAFQSGNITSVYCKATTPPTINPAAFNQVNTWYVLKIYVPMDSVDDYKGATYWSSYADAIVGYDF